MSYANRKKRYYEGLGQFLPKNAEYKTLVSQCKSYDDIDLDINEQAEHHDSLVKQEMNMYKNESLVEKQQRHFNNRLNELYYKKADELEKKHSFEKMVPVMEVNYETLEKDMVVLRTSRQKVEDIIMIGEPNGMFMAVDSFDRMTIH